MKTKFLNSNKPWLTLILLMLAFSAVAETKQVELDKHAKAEKQIRTELSAFPVESVKPTPIAGLYEVIVGSQIIYVTADMHYVFEGSLIDNRAKVNLTEKTQNAIRAKIFSDSKNQYVAFKPKGQPKHIINVFTDVDCGFCRKLHQEVSKLNDKGVEVRYFLYPRAGADSSSARKLESIWCAQNQQQAMTRAKNNQHIEAKRCDNPINQHIELAHKVGLTGTPLILSNGGTKINGYRPADELYRILQKEALLKN